MTPTNLEMFNATTADVESAFLAASTRGYRRERGITFTPQWVVDFMAALIAGDREEECQVIDAGSGAGRFAEAAAKALPRAHVMAVESDSSLAESLRNLKSISRKRYSVVEESFLSVQFPRRSPKIFIGNPPYIRHHALSRDDKAWLREAGIRLGCSFSELAGFHAYFLVRCMLDAAPGDRLVMILPTEWLETRYGRDLKAVLLEKSREIRLYVFAPGVQVFDGVMTTSVILDVVFGDPGRRVKACLVEPGDLVPGGPLETLCLPGVDPEKSNWLQLAWSAVGCRRDEPVELANLVELGDLFSVHRGQVTGMNAIWIAGPEAAKWVPKRYLVPCVTDGREILNAPGGVLRSAAHLRKVVDLPRSLDSMAERERDGISRFLEHAERNGARNTYIGSHRTPWWRVGLKEPPAIVMSYMARRAPKVALNECGARLLNVAHGLYPKVKLSQARLRAIVKWLNDSPSIGVGRTYAGGLIKVEPGDVLRIRVPVPGTTGLAA